MWFLGSWESKKASFGVVPVLAFLDSHEPRNHTGEKREGRGERGEEKRTAGTHIFILPTLEIVSERQKSARDTPLGHLNRAVPFSKIRVYFGMKWAKIIPGFLKTVPLG